MSNSKTKDLAQKLTDEWIVKMPYGTATHGACYRDGIIKGIEYSDQTNKSLLEEIEKYKSSLASSERFRMQDGASHNNEKNQDWQKINELKAEIERLNDVISTRDGKCFDEQYETQIQSLQSQLNIENELLRETVMRANFAMPESERDEKWFEEKIDITKDNNFTERIFEKLNLGKI